MFPAVARRSAYRRLAQVFARPRIHEVIGRNALLELLEGIFEYLEVFARRALELLSLLLRQLDANSIAVHGGLPAVCVNRVVERNSTARPFYSKCSRCAGKW